MNRIDTLFASPNNATKLITYITAGDYKPELTVPLMHSLVKSGADLIEIGVPFSDPMADGPVIQAACERALEHKVTIIDVLSMIAEFRQQDSTTPVVLMGYLNPIECVGYDKFLELAKKSDIDGTIIVDLPPEEAGDWIKSTQQLGLHNIFLTSPTTRPDRMQLISQLGGGFCYYVSLKGVTGSKKLDLNEVSAKVSVLRENVGMPIGVGFGISDAESAAAVGQIADAVIVGSAIVKRIADNIGDDAKIIEQIEQLVGSMRIALDQPSEKTVSGQNT